MNEVACLRHLAATGSVPQVIDGDCEPFLIAERLPGEDATLGYRTIHAAATGLPALSHAIGQAQGRLTAFPLPVSGRGYCPVRDFTVMPWPADPQQMLSHYLDICRRIVQVLPEYGTGIFEPSLALLSAQLPSIGLRRRCLFHEDIANLKIDQGRFAGFFDLEMCRAGTDMMQLGVGLQCCGPGRLSWRFFKRGFEDGAGQVLTSDDLHSAVAMHHLYAWLRICRWGWWDGDPAQLGHLRDSESEIAYWRTFLTDSVAMMHAEADLSAICTAAGL